MKDFEKGDPVWKLLGEARRVEADPFFSRNVLREVRKLRADQGGVVETILSFFRQPILAGVAAAMIVLVFVFLSAESTTKFAGADTLLPDEAATVSEGEFDPTVEIESIGYLGELMAISDPAELDDAALADLSLLASR